MSIVKFRNRTNGNGETQNTPRIVPGFRMLPSLLDDFATPSWTRDLMQDFFNDDLLSGVGRIGSTLPAVNITETAEDVIIEMAAPGMKKNDFKVEVDNDQLLISYEKQKEEEDGKRNHWRREFNFESFNRTFTLPSIVEREKVQATYTDGILRVSIPKKEEAKKKPARTINVQ